MKDPALPLASLVKQAMHKTDHVPHSHIPSATSIVNSLETPLFTLSPNFTEESLDILNFLDVDDFGCLQEDSSTLPETTLTLPSPAPVERSLFSAPSSATEAASGDTQHPHSFLSIQRLIQTAINDCSPSITPPCAPNPHSYACVVRERPLTPPHLKITKLAVRSFSNSPISLHPTPLSHPPPTSYDGLYENRVMYDFNTARKIVDHQPILPRPPLLTPAPASCLSTSPASASPPQAMDKLTGKKRKAEDMLDGSNEEGTDQERKRQRNRMAAQASRDRKKQHMETLERRVSELEAENAELRQELDRLRGTSQAVVTSSSIASQPATDNGPRRFQIFIEIEE